MTEHSGIESGNSKGGSRDVTALEYGLIAVLAAVAIVGAFTGFGRALSSGFSTIAGHFGATVN